MNGAHPEKIDDYILLKSLGKGGMGEVFLAYDPHCKRQVALKQIRDDLKSHPIMMERFLREAQVAAQLTHPSIIPIFAIHKSPEKTYYTMPYVEGETLKEILKKSIEEEKEGEVVHPIGSSIPALTRIFLSLCEAIAYTHAKGILHRDIKPDNIIVGKYGEVMLLDWGLADFIGKADPVEEIDENETVYKDLTRPGKVPGTLNYIAPERVRGEPSQVGTDIYSLGVILFQLLTLRSPFHRSSVKKFKKTMHLEPIPDPIETAPYRDIPQLLADIAKHCLAFSPDERYQSVDEIIAELKSYFEGKPEWILIAQLDPHAKEDWEFQENVLLARHTAITRSPEVMQWVSLMISESSFQGNIRIEADVTIRPESQGIGFLLGIPEAPERKELSQGYCVWIGKGCTLFHNNIEVMALREADCADSAPHTICIEKVDNHLYLHVDNKKIFHYISHIPLAGTHVGLTCRDADFEMAPMRILLGSQNVMVNCLAVPDAFLANRNYPKALLEYRRIASSFSGRSEGREAIFRAGITLLEKSSSLSSQEEKERLQLLALEEFGKLRSGPAAPLEYLGKSLVYKATSEIEEEIKCLELCLRKYPRHPLLKRIREHITFRMHETASGERIAAYHFALLAVRFLPQIFKSEDHAQLILSLKKHLEKLPFFLLPDADEDHLACQLAFWLNKPITLVEIIETSPSPSIVANALYGLLAMGRSDWAEENLSHLKDPKEAALLQSALLYFKEGAQPALASLLKQLSPSPTNAEMRCAYFLFDRALLDNRSEEVLPYFKEFPSTLPLDALHIQACLLQNAWPAAEQLLDTYPPEILGDEYSALFGPMGCFLVHAEGEKIATSHFGGSIDLPYPPTTMLLSYALRGRIDSEKGWSVQAFPWEKIALHRQMQLYFHCAKNPKKAEGSIEALHRLLRELAEL